MNSSFRFILDKVQRAKSFVRCMTVEGAQTPVDSSDLPGSRLRYWKNTFVIIRRAVEAWVANRGPSRGAALAFYTLFSISPVLIIITSVAGSFLGYATVKDAVIKESAMIAGDAGAQVVKSILQRGVNPTSSFIAGIIGLIAMIIGSTSVFVELQNALDNIWKCEAKNAGGVWNFIRARLLSLVITLTMTLIIMVSIVFSAVVQDIANFGGGLIKEHAFLLESLNFVFLFAMGMFLFAMIYKLLPSATIKWEDVWMGAAITSVLFTIGKTLIGFYLVHSATASFFGAAGSLILLLFWIYYSAQIFLLGAEFTKQYADFLASRPVRRDKG